jgi:hypothetical protein
VEKDNGRKEKEAGGAGGWRRIKTLGETMEERKERGEENRCRHGVCIFSFSSSL